MQLNGWNKGFAVKEKCPSNRRADALQKYLMFKSTGCFVGCFVGGYERPAVPLMSGRLVRLFNSCFQASWR